MPAFFTGKALCERALRFASEVACETLWPTHCAVCDRPGEVLCQTCRDALPFVDGAKSCPYCGSPFGLRQCDFCNSLALGRLGRTRLPFDACASATAYSEATGTLVRAFKDGGEQRLGTQLAHIMARYVAPTWHVSAVTYVPATRAAYRSRGFDHAAILAHEIARVLEVPFASLFERPHSRDQRTLGALGRMSNMQNRLRLREEARQRARESYLQNDGVLVIDDVFTTGATLCAACDELSLIAPHIYGLTFARG